MQLTGAHVVVTGGSRGIGLAIAEEMAARGAHLSLVARDGERLRAASERLGACAVRADLSHDDQVAAVLPTAVEAHGPVDVLVNNAGVNVPMPLARCSKEQLAATIATNLHAPLELTRAVLGPMLERRSGVIVNISSVAGHIAMRHVLPYSSTKAGLTLATRTLQRELRDTGVHANLVVLGLVATDMYDGSVNDEADPFTRAGTKRFARFVAPLQSGRVAQRIVDAVASDRRRDLVLPATSLPMHQIGKVNTLVTDLLFAGLPTEEQR